MTTLEQPRDQYAELQEAHHDELHTLRRRTRLAAATAVVLAAALVTLGVWAFTNGESQSETAPTDQVQELFDAYTDAWNAHDAEAFARLTTDSFVHQDGRTFIDKAEQAQVLAQGEINDLHVVDLGEPQMVGDGPWYLASATRLEWTSGAPVGISVFTIVADEGTLKVSRHVWIGE